MVFKQVMNKTHKTRGRKMKLSMKISALLASVLTIGMVSSAGAALVSSHTDRAAWEAAAGGTPDFFEDFNSIPGGPEIPLSPPLVVGTLTIEGVSKTTTTQPSLANVGLEDQLVDGSLYILVRVGTHSSLDESLTFTFDTSITSFGFDLNPNPGRLEGWAMEFTTNGSGGGTFNLPVEDITEFRGFVFDTPFTSFTLTSSANDAPWGLDNLAAVSPVPVPAAAWLFGSGLIGLIGVARRKLA